MRSCQISAFAANAIALSAFLPLRASARMFAVAVRRVFLFSPVHRYTHAAGQLTFKHRSPNYRNTVKRERIHRHTWGYVYARDLIKFYDTVGYRANDLK